MAEHDLRTASPAQIRERIGMFWSLGEAQDALAARRLQPLFAASDAEIEKAFVAERLPIRLVLPWILYRNRRLAYVASIALEETRQAIASPSLRTSADMKMSWPNALYALWNRLAANDGVVAYDGEISDRIIPADKWPEFRFMVCKDVGYGRSARSIGFPYASQAALPLHEGCGTDLAYDDVWVSRDDVLREWPEPQSSCDPRDARQPTANAIDDSSAKVRFSVAGARKSAEVRGRGAQDRNEKDVLPVVAALREQYPSFSSNRIATIAIERGVRLGHRSIVNYISALEAEGRIQRKQKACS